jgi:cation diffusion facilitator CzcD-associated flavoprotein CzcO
MNRPVLIIGAGIAGLSLARALRVRGVAFDIVE